MLNVLPVIGRGFAVAVSEEAKHNAKWTFVGAVAAAIIAALIALVPTYFPGGDDKAADTKGTNGSAGTPEGAAQPTGPGQVVYKIKYLNDGDVQQDDVIVQLKLPAGAVYMLGTTQFSASSTGNKWKSLSTDTIAKVGINIGSYAPGGAGYLRFVAHVDQKTAGLCSSSGLTTSVKSSAQDGKSSGSSLSVEVTC
ncbi:hypothetical protein [Streptomyces sp. NPDC047024]|uniref:hypothetical protein n=1 Tax=Streptomyces sp. NPDC047024 TaxID=3155476 RepID=UPI0033FCB6CC